MAETRKVTVHLPPGLLERAQEATGQGVTGTIRRGLEVVAASPSYKKLRRLRGKVRFSIDIDELREDR